MQFVIQDSQVCHFGIFYHDMTPVYNFIIDNSVNYLVYSYKSQYSYFSS